jgi:hypothetical protein
MLAKLLVIISIIKLFICEEMERRLEEVCKDYSQYNNDDSFLSQSKDSSFLIITNCNNLQQMEYVYSIYYSFPLHELKFQCFCKEEVQNLHLKLTYNRKIIQNLEIEHFSADILQNLQKTFKSIQLLSQNGITCLLILNRK